MSDDNLRFWAALEKTDASATKPFQRAGGFRGTATKPIYHIKRMTEVFGPCGVGWGMGKPDFQLVPAENEILVYCTVSLWYMDGEARGEVFGVGGDKVVAQQRSGPFVSDEAFKAAYTDALGNAMKHVGVGADIHMGEFDKYGRDRDDAPPVQRQSSPPPQSPPQPRTAPPAASAARDMQKEVNREFAGGHHSHMIGQPAPRQVPPATDSSVHLPPSPEEPPAVTAARDANRARFWARESYAIDPEVIQGGIGKWDAEVLAKARAAPSLDSFVKLKVDNKDAGYAERWERTVQVAVIRHFRQEMAAIEARLAKAEERAA